MSMLRHTLVALAWSCAISGQLLADAVQTLPATSSEVATTQKSKTDQALDAIKKSGTYLKDQFQAIFSNADYNSDTLTISVGEYKGIIFLGAGIMYNFGFAGAGDITKPLPSLWTAEQKPRRKASGARTIGQYNLLNAGLNAVGATQVVNFFDTAKNLSPDQVFLLRTITLLVTAYRNRKTAAFPATKNVSTEMFTLFSRLTKTINPQTKKSYTLDDVLRKAPPVLISMLKKIVIGGAAAYVFLDQAWKAYVRAATYKFMGDKGYNPAKDQRKLTDLQTIERLLAIGVRAKARDYSNARGYYLLTHEGEKRQAAVDAARKRVVQFGPEQATGKSAAELAKRQVAIVNAQRYFAKGALRQVYPRVVIARSKVEYETVVEHLLPYLKKKVEEKTISGQTIWVLNESIAGFVAREFARTSVLSDSYARNQDKVQEVAYLVGLDLKELEGDIAGIKKEVPPPVEAPEPDAQTLDVLNKSLLDDDEDPFASTGAIAAPAA